MRVVCAPNAFKGTLTAAEAAAALAEGATAAGAEAIAVPVADGGDGTLDVLLAAAGPRGRTTVHTVCGPLGDPTSARLGWIDARTAVVELAEAAGLRLLGGHNRDPVRATTFGAGELIVSAVESGARRIVIGVGGSATTDGGTGMLLALGARLRDAAGHTVSRHGGLLDVASVDLDAARETVRGVRLDVAVDVDNPLFGGNGAAVVFAPQKGADAATVALLDAALHRYAEIVEIALDAPGLAGRPGMGAAGGSAFGLAAAGATLCPGAALVCDQTGLDDAIAGADLVITGEGALDAQTRRGKAPAEVARRSRRAGTGCIAVAGRVDDPLPDLFDGARALDTDPHDRAAALARLRDVAADIVTNWRRTPR